MKIRSVLFGLSILLLSLPAQAIPPPEAVISIWQSLLQFLGVASVFVGGAILSMRQFFGMYIVGWRRAAFYIALSIIFVWVLWLLLGGQVAKAKPARPVLGELVSMNELIKREESDWIRKWKLETVDEMKHELNLARESRNLSKHEFGLVPSFSPTHLHQLVKTQRQQLYILDIREEFERSRFGIPVNGSARYGDIAGDIIPAHLPKNTVIVVLCHSGLRGYFGASLLQQKGYSKAAFLQGGLAAWNAQKLPIRGESEYSAKKRWLPNEKEAQKLDALKIQVDAEGSKLVEGIPSLIKLPYETATTKDLENLLLVSSSLPILLVCNTYGGCFHSTNMAWLIEDKGGKVAAIYDETGDYAKGFFD